MEIIIAVFLGVWVAGASYLAFVRIAKDFKEIEKEAAIKKSKAGSEG